MKITPVDHGLKLGVSPSKRTPGVHMSALYNSLYQELEPKRFKKGSSPDPLRLEFGLALEEMLEEGLKQRLGTEEDIERPGEFVTNEGIIYTPDLIIYTDKERLGEIKLTWMSSREVPREETTRPFPPKFNKYFTQMKCYGYHLEMPHQRLLAFFVNGDFRPARPELLAWDIEFTLREMRDEWLMVKNHGIHAGLIV